MTNEMPEYVTMVDEVITKLRHDVRGELSPSRTMERATFMTALVNALRLRHDIEMDLNKPAVGEKKTESVQDLMEKSEKTTLQRGE